MEMVLRWIYHVLVLHTILNFIEILFLFVEDEIEIYSLQQYRILILQDKQLSTTFNTFRQFG